MKTHLINIPIVIIAVLVIASAFYFVSIYIFGSGHFSGDGVLEDRGIWSFPRYIIRFPKRHVSHETQQLSFSAKNLPSSTMTLFICISSEKGDESSDLEELIRRTFDMKHVCISDASNSIIKESGEHYETNHSWILRVTMNHRHNVFVFGIQSLWI